MINVIEQSIDQRLSPIRSEKPPIPAQRTSLPLAADLNSAPKYAQPNQSGSQGRPQVRSRRSSTILQPSSSLQEKQSSITAQISGSQNAQPLKKEEPLAPLDSSLIKTRPKQKSKRPPSSKPKKDGLSNSSEASQPDLSIGQGTSSSVVSKTNTSNPLMSISHTLSNTNLFSNKKTGGDKKLTLNQSISSDHPEEILNAITYAMKQLDQYIKSKKRKNNSTALRKAKSLHSQFQVIYSNIHQLPP